VARDAGVPNIDPRLLPEIPRQDEIDLVLGKDSGRDSAGSESEDFDFSDFDNFGDELGDHDGSNSIRKRRKVKPIESEDEIIKRKQREDDASKGHNTSQ